MKKLVIYGTLALVLVLTASQLVFAGPKNGKGGNCGGGMSNRGAINWVSELKLTDDQVTKIQGILQKDAADTEALYNTLHKTQTELRNLGWSKNYSEDKINALQDTIQKTHESIQASHQTAMKEIYALLTDAQKKIYDDKGGCPGTPGEGRGPGNGGKGGRRGCGNCDGTCPRP